MVTHSNITIQIFNNMKKTELSIGDWVKVPELMRSCDNDHDDSFNGIFEVKRLGDYDLDVCSFNELSYYEIEPVMITKAILEKFGFVEKESSKEANIFEYRTADLLVIYSTTLASIDILKAKEKLPEDNNTTVDEAGNMIEFNLSAKILYVHQLQHLLRLVGKELNRK